MKKLMFLFVIVFGLLIPMQAQVKVSVAYDKAFLTNNEASDIYDKVQGISVKALYGVSKNMYMGFYWDNLSGDLDNAFVGEGPSGETCKLNYKTQSIGVEADYYFDWLYVMAKVGSFTWEDKYSGSLDNSNEKATGKSIALGLGIDLKFTKRMSLFGEISHSWVSINEYDFVKDPFNSWNLGLGIRFKFGGK